MTQNPFGQTHENMHTGPVSQQMNHGGHELFDVHEALSCTVAALNQAILLRPYVKDPELLDILDRQYRFTLNEYNSTVEAFKTGQDPSQPTGSYKMEGGNDFVYGMKASQPTKPIQSEAELSDQIISGYLLGSAKTGATSKTTAALETCNPVVRRVLADSIPNCIEMGYELSIYQNKHHYYQIPQLAQQDMQQLLNSFATAGQPAMPNHTVQ
ncbi:spore coat protein [Sporosarcina sp. FSL K6-2383]|uniref:spore coat protein n=1 Tax=Sporosarcina sp. FSL K6-2383 TaxID=2921556 RepID=UPI00315B0C7A